jgi:hypothetical protein
MHVHPPIHAGWPDDSSFVLADAPKHWAEFTSAGRLLIA